MKLHKIEKRKNTNDKVVVLTFKKWGFSADRYIKYDLIKHPDLSKYWMFINSGEIEFKYSDVINTFLEMGLDHYYVDEQN